jgi:hypothetical protein
MDETNKKRNEAFFSRFKTQNLFIHKTKTLTVREKKEKLKKK